MSKVLVFSDTHFPFQRKGYLEFLKKVYEAYECDTVICCGDLLDQYCWTRFLKNPDADGAKIEFRNTMKELNKLYKAFPVLTMTIGNHDARLLKRASEVGIPSWAIKSFKEMYNMPVGWDLVESVIVDGVKYVHGDGLTAQTKLSVQKTIRSVVYGHCHKGSVSYLATDRELLFGMCVGCLVDQKAYAFEYAKHQLEKSFIGCGVVINGIPQLIPMKLKSKMV